MDFSFLSKMGFSMDDIGKIGEIIMSGGDENKIADYVAENVDLRPAAIIDRFDLRRPIYRQLAAYGHMGREDLDIPWEKTDIAEDIKAALL
jgi:S-adenosylmethionine synthetase